MDLANYQISLGIIVALAFFGFNRVDFFILVIIIILLLFVVRNEFTNKFNSYKNSMNIK